MNRDIPGRSAHWRWRRLLAAVALVPLALAAGVVPAEAQGGDWRAEQARYRNHARLTRAIDSLRRAHPQLIQVSEIATSPGGRAVHAVRIGTGDDVDSRPALLLLANAYGPHLVGSEIAVAAIADLTGGATSDTAVASLLRRATIYVIPRLNPDAAEAFFASPLVERIRNAEPFDDDSDGRTDEDDLVDLNGDGVVTAMRVQDPAGDWMSDPDEPLVMRRADRSKGESGGWKLMVESRDMDDDGAMGEDPAGGTDISRNFSNAYRFFAPGAGTHSFSSVEARAVAEFYVTHPNIAVVYVLGQHDNLMTPWEFRRQAGIGGNPQGTSAGGPFSSILAQDAPYYAEMSRRYKSSTGATGSPSSGALEGDPASHAYFDMGRLAFASRGWWPVVARDSAARGAGAGAGGSSAANDQKNTIKWLRANRPSMVTEWTPVTHPDFPGQVVEVGGVHPFAAWNPPAAALDSVTRAQSLFVRELASLLPRLTLRNVRVEHVGDRVYRVTAQLGNDGYFPTQSAIGARAQWPRRVRVDLELQGQSIASGRKVQMISPIAGSGATTEVSWLVVGAAGSSVTVKAESPVAGSVSRTITLQAR
ncbi:MAG TPA: M14 family zinc carboxypeptidase [Gemmatimonadales bacterium]|nr:M14 family zinc carboxypeptidase [Gemmatimonadales bacterium]